MFFIIGNPRSGTSLFRLLLTSHTDIHIPPECGFMVWWLEKYKNWSWAEGDLELFLDDLFSAKKIEFWNLDRESLTADLWDVKPKDYASLAQAIYLHHRNKSGKINAVLGDKNNFHLNHIFDLNQLFPDSKFVHIIRDGRDVATSYVNMSKIQSQSDYRPRLPSSIEKIAKEWRKNIEEIHKGFAKLARESFLEIRYEDLVLETEKTLLKVCEFLGQNYQPTMLDFYLNNQENSLEPSEFMAWKSRTLNKIDPSAIGKWKNLPQDDIERFENISGEVLSKYNYPVASIAGEI